MRSAPRFLLLASLLGLGCSESAEPATQPQPAAPAPRNEGTPSDESREGTSESDDGERSEPAARAETEDPKAPVRRVECRGGEVVVTWQNATGDDAVAETAKLSFSAAGHRSWSYDFTYEDGVLASARHRISSWAFAGGDVDRPQTHDTVVERRYELEDGKLTACTERRAAGPGDAIDGLVQDAQAKKIDCKHAEPVVALAGRAAQPIEDADAAWLDAACRSDKSSALRL